MKKLLLSFVALCVLAGSALAQSSPQTFTRIRDASNPNDMAGVFRLSLTLSPSDFGLYTASGSYYFDGTAMRRLAGAQATGNTVPAATYAPYGLSLGYFFNGTTWHRVTGAQANSNVVPAVTTAPYGLSLGHFFNGATWQRSTGPIVGADNVSNATPGLWGHNLLYSFDGATWDRITSAAAGDALGATQQGLNTLSYNLFYNSGATLYQRWTGETIDDSMTLAPVGPFVASYSVFGSLDGALSRRVTGEMWDGTMTATPTNPNTNAFNVFYNSVAGSSTQWYGEPVDDAMTAAPATPFVASYGVFGSLDGALSRRVTGEMWDAVMTAAPTSLNTNAFGVFHNGTAGQYWAGLPAGDTMGATPNAPFVLSLGSFYDSSTSHFMRWRGEPLDDDLATDTPTAPLVGAYNLFYDADAPNARRWYGGLLSTTITAPRAPYVGSMSYGYESVGGVFHPLRIDSNGNSYVLQAELLPGEDDVNDWRKVRVQSVEPYTPSKTTTATVDATGNIVVLSTVEVIGYSNYTVNIKNTGGVNALDTVYVEVSPDGSTWSSIVTYDTNIAAGGNARICSVTNNSDRYLRVRAAATAAVTTSTDCWFTARVSN